MLYLYLFEGLLRIQWICWCNNSRTPLGGAIFIWIWRQDIRAVCPNPLTPLWCLTSHTPPPISFYFSLSPSCKWLPTSSISSYFLVPNQDLAVCVVLLVSLSLRWCQQARTFPAKVCHAHAFCVIAVHSGINTFHPFALGFFFTCAEKCHLYILWISMIVWRLKNKVSERTRL